MQQYHQMSKKSINKKARENYLLMIPIRKVALWNKNVKTRLQENIHGSMKNSDSQPDFAENTYKPGVVS